MKNKLKNNCKYILKNLNLPAFTSNQVTKPLKINQLAL